MKKKKKAKKVQKGSQSEHPYITNSNSKQITE